MKHRRTHLLVIIVALAAVAGVVSFAARGNGSQSQASKSRASITPIISTVYAKPEASPDSSAAAAQNQLLRNQLSWTFGGKQQRGWYLYDELLSETLSTKDDPVSDGFADAVVKWQKKRGLGKSGVLDQTSWMAMVAQWQGHRLKNRTSATPEQLLTAPSSDFYDPSRAAELRQVERETYAAYKKMLAAAIDDLKLPHTAADELAPKERYFKIVSAFRSPAYQEELRRKSPNAGSAGLAVNNSPHFTGRALDLYVGGDPVDTKDANRAIQVNTPAYKWLVRNAERFGFRPYFYEPWHWEYVK